MYGEEISKETNDFLQEYFVKPQLINSGHDEVDRKAEGLKRAIQKCFIQHFILGIENVSQVIQEDDNSSKIYNALAEKESKEVANEVFENAIKEVKEFIAGEFGMAPRRKKEHEILAEELEKKYGEKSIDSNVNRVILKGGSVGSGGCSDGGCGCC